MRKPWLLDLFAGAGGCSVGYARAGFRVAGVDHEPHPDYPYKLIIADALEYLSSANLDRYAVIHASPPCQAYATMNHRRQRYRPTKKMILPVRRALRRWARTSGGLYVIENVTGARRHMPDAILLHGGMFGLGVHRPRLFESNGKIVPARGSITDGPIGVYGRKPDGRWTWKRANGTEARVARSLAEGQAAMGIDWMQWADLTQAVPPAYAEHIGRQLLDQLAGT